MADTDQHLGPMSQTFQKPGEVLRLFQLAVSEALAKQAADDSAKMKTTGASRKAGTAAATDAK